MNRQWHLAQWAEIRWWKRYLKNREPGAYRAWKLKYWQDFLAACDLSELSGLRVLDAGCGPAGVFTALPSCEVDAVDPLLGQYERIPHFRREDFPWVRFYPVALEDFPEEEDYGAAFCLNALNHMDDIPRCLGLLFRALKPGGRLVVSVDAHKYEGLKRLFRKIPLDVLHPFQESHAGYRKLFAEAGFEEKSGFCYKKGGIFDYWVWILQKQTS